MVVSGFHNLVFLSLLQLIGNKWACIYITNFPPQWNNVNVSVQHKHSQFNSLYSTFKTVKWQTTQVIQWMYRKEMLYNLMHKMQFILSCHILHNPFIGLTVFCTFFSIPVPLIEMLCFSVLQPGYILWLLWGTTIYLLREKYGAVICIPLFIFIWWVIQL